MDFSYYNNKNEKIRLEISAGQHWDELNVENNKLNSIFSKVDNRNGKGDGIISDDELILLEKILQKADKTIETLANNKILENEELEEIAKQIEKGEIVLSSGKSIRTPENICQKGCIIIEGGDRGNGDDTVKKDLQKRFPPELYDVEINYDGRNYHYKIYDLNIENNNTDRPQILSQNIIVLREDGLEIQFSDNYNKEITDVEKNDYSKIRTSGNVGQLVITDKNGNKHTLNYTLDDCWTNDILDCRRVKQSVSEFFAKLPEETINELIQQNVEEVLFTSEYEDPLLLDKDYYKNKMDENGLVIDIDNKYATIISPEFALKRREYETDLSVTRNDDYEVNIKNTSDTSSLLTIALPNGEETQIAVRGRDRDEFNQWQITKLKNMFSELPPIVLEDLTKEISGITFTSYTNSGIYVYGSNEIGYNADSDFDTPIISFVHELGHAIDNQNGTMFSKSPEFVTKFEEFEALTRKFKVDTWNHALDNPAEFFASEYANKHFPADKTINNHIAELERALEGFDTSDNPEKQLCFKLFKELQNDVHNYIEEARKSDKSVRADDTIKNIVKNEFQDIISKMDENFYYLKHHLAAQNAELDIIGTLSADDEDFEYMIQSYEKFTQNEFENIFGKHKVPKEIQEIYTELIEKLKVVRNRIKNN